MCVQGKQTIHVLSKYQNKNSNVSIAPSIKKISIQICMHLKKNKIIHCAKLFAYIRIRFDNLKCPILKSYKQTPLLSQISST